MHFDELISEGIGNSSVNDNSHTSETSEETSHEGKVNKFYRILLLQFIFWYFRYNNVVKIEMQGLGVDVSVSTNQSDESRSIAQKKEQLKEWI